MDITTQSMAASQGANGYHVENLLKDMDVIHLKSQIAGKLWLFYQVIFFDHPSKSMSIFGVIY